MAPPSPKRRASPRQPAATCRPAKSTWTVVRPRRSRDPSITSSWRRAKGGRRSGGAAGGHPHPPPAGVGGAAAGADEGPVTEGGPEPLPAVEDEPAKRLERREQLG